MAGPATSTSYDALLKECWPQEDIYDELYDINESFYGMCPKDTGFYEKFRHIAVGHGHTQGISASFSAAKANKNPTVQDEFKISPVTYYSFFSIQRQLLRRAQQKKAAILPALDRETRMAIHGWKRMTGIYLANISGVGDLGRANSSSLAATAVITLTNVADTKHFYKGMTVELSVDNTGSAGVKASSSPLRVLKVDRESGAITFETNITTAVPTAAASDYLYRGGDYNNIVKGVYAWVPIATPGATSFFGLDRTGDPQLLGGWRVNCAGLAPRAALKKTLKVLKEIGSKPTHAFLSPNDYLNLQMEIESTGVVKSVKEPAAAIGKYKWGVPFEGIEVMGPAGPVKVMFDINLIDNYPLVTQLNTWTFATMGDAPYFDETDGNRILRETDADAYEGRFIGDMQLYNEAPGFSAIALLAGS